MSKCEGCDDCRCPDCPPKKTYQLSLTDWQLECLEEVLRIEDRTCCPMEVRWELEEAKKRVDKSGV